MKLCSPGETHLDFKCMEDHQKGFRQESNTYLSFLKDHSSWDMWRMSQEERARRHCFGTEPKLLPPPPLLRLFCFGSKEGRADEHQQAPAPC